LNKCPTSEEYITTDLASDGEGLSQEKAPGGLARGRRRMGDMVVSGYEERRSKIAEIEDMN
jgi:hypothetical protein